MELGHNTCINVTCFNFVHRSYYLILHMYSKHFLKKRVPQQILEILLFEGRLKYCTVGHTSS
jgi:hypothetical protein